jgi:hypothetical protein
MGIFVEILRHMVTPLASVMDPSQRAWLEKKKKKMMMILDQDV